MAIIWVGAYTPDMGGTATGISALRVRDDGGLDDHLGLAVATSSPSFVARHPSLPVVYSVGEKDATFRAFRVVGDGRLEPLGQALPAGEAACHIAVDAAGRFAVVACWGSGQVLVYALDPTTGEITGRSDAAPAHDPYDGVPETELVAPRPDYAPRVSRAHFTHFLPDGRVLTTDLGYDLVRVWRVGDDGNALELDHELTFPYGVGPRHVAAGASGRLHVICEYAVKVFTLAPDADGRYAIVGSTPVRRAPLEPGEYAAHLTASPDGTLLYATVRSSDVVAVLSAGADGSVTPLTEVPSGAHWPRHHLVLGSRLYVANQLADEVTVFALGADGLPGEIVQRLPTPAPTALVPD